MEENSTPIKDFSSAGAEKLREMTENSNMYIDFLKFHGRVFKHSTSVALEFFTQRPETKFIATREQWAKINCTVAMGSEAIRFIDSDGKNTDLYDFSQIEDAKPPYQWTINKSNANEFKSKLGIPEKTPIISGVINSTVNQSNITSCMSRLGIPPQNYKEFSKSYLNAVQLIMAGRLEIGGNKFNIPSDLTVLKMLKTESQKLAFLTYAAKDAHDALMKIEMVAKSINTMERIEKNDLREMENTDANRTEERTRRGTSVNTSGTTGKQSDRSESNESRRNTGLGNDTKNHEWKEHEMVSGVQNEDGGESGVLVQVQSDMRTLQPESDGIRNVGGGRTDRNLWNEVDDVHGGELSTSGRGNEAVSQVSDSGSFSGEERTGVQGLTGRPVRTGESTSDGLRGSAEMGTGENVLLGQHSDEGNSLSSGDRSIEEKMSAVFSSDETEKTSAEKTDVLVLNDKDKLVQITAEIGEKQKMYVDMIDSEDYEKATEILSELTELTIKAKELKEKIQAEPLTKKDVEVMLEIKPPRKSVQNMTETDTAKTVKLESMLGKGMGEKSPYAMRKNGGNDWRNDESKTVNIVEIKTHNVLKKTKLARKDIDVQSIPTGTFINNDTNAEIPFKRNGIDESIAKAIQDSRSISVEARMNALYHMEEIIRDSVYFDSQTSEYHPEKSKNKSPNTMFIHRFYGVMKYNDDFYLTNLAVEESFNTDEKGIIKNTNNSFYSVRDIKITPVQLLGYQTHAQMATAIEDAPTGAIISIPQLYQFVKAFDKNFFENPDAVGREARETELFLQAKYMDAEKDDENNTETKKQIIEFAKSHNISIHEAKKELERAVERYDGFIADKKENKGFSNERNSELEMCIHKAFDKIRKINNFTEPQAEFINNLEKFSVTNHIINNIVSSAFEKSRRFSSLYTSENWIDSSIFNGRLPKIKNALNEEIKVQTELLKQEKAQKPPAEKEKKLAPEIVEIDLKDGIEKAPQIQINSSELKIDMEETPQIIFLETNETDGKFYFNETIFTYDIENVTVEVQESFDNLNGFDNQETLSVEDGAAKISELMKFYPNKNMHISIVYENGESESLMQYINQVSGDYPLVKVSPNKQVPEFINHKTCTVQEYNDLLAEASKNIPEGQEFTLHFKVVLSNKRMYEERFKLTKDTGKLSEILPAFKDEKQSERDYLKALKMVLDEENKLKNFETIDDSNNNNTPENPPENTSETVEESKSQTAIENEQKYPYVSVKAGLNYDKYISPELEQKNYTIPEFNDALQKLSERWDGEEYETKSAFVTLTIHISETESFEKRLNAEYQFRTLSERLEYETDWFNLETELRKAVKEAEKQEETPELTEKENSFFDEETAEQMSLFDESVDVPENNRENEKIKPVKHNPTNAEKLYNQFTEMFPDIVSGEHTYERYGNVGDAYEPLTVEHLGGNTYSFMTYFIQNGDLMRDPDFEFELDHENKTLNILEYQQDGSIFGTVYQRVYDENNNPDLKLLTALEKNFMQNLKNAQNMERPLTSYTDKNGNKFNSNNEPETNEPEEPEINDKSPELREVLNKFSEKYGLGELNIELNYYNCKLTEKFADGTDFSLGEINNPEYGKPFTSDELKIALEEFEKASEARNQNISDIYSRQSIAKIHGGVSKLPKVQKNLPEITYASKPSEKIRNNILAIREMIRLENAEKSGEEPYDKKSNQYNSRPASEYRLRQYCGWGGLSQVFDERFKQYDYNRRELQSLLTPEEYAEAKASSLNAHYTPQIIIDAMYKAVKNMDLPCDAKILEPACGTGNFISRLPHSFSDAEITGVELDSITARIAKQINRDNEKVKIINSGFENSGLANNSFDLAIGNVPFGDYNMNDPDYVQDWRIHDAFFRKALDKVASGGVVAFVTSTGTMDKANPKIREYLAVQAELIGAVRLPDNAFSDAGTKTSTDIIFLKKRENPLSVHEPKPDWCYTIPDKNGFKINSYFVQNPQMVLGEMKKTTFQNRLTCEPFEGADLEKQLNEAIKNLNAKITVAKREKEVNEQRGNIEAWGKNFTFQLKDNKVYYRNGGKMEEIKCNHTEKEMIKKLCEIRDVTRKLIDCQKTSMRDEELVPVRENLNKLYDEYRAKHGELSSKSVKKLFGSDSDYPILQSLENYNKETEKVEKADIFFRRTVNPMLEIKSVESVEEALQVSLDRKGRPDIQYMAVLLDKSPENVCNELLEKGHIFIDPEKELPDKPFSGVVERSEYLSGNVRMKMTIAEEYAKSNPEYNQNVDALKTVIPEDIKAEEISVQMGCTWIEPQDYTAFLEHLSGRTGYYNSRSCDVSYSPTTGEFDVLNAKSKKGLNLNETTTYGTADLNMYQLAEKILNQRRIVVQREKISTKDPTKTVTRTDPKATKIALEKAKLIRAEFQKWIFADDKRKAKYERKYNDIFNSIVGRNYDGSHLTFSGMANDFTLRPHQKNCVARAIYGGNTLAAHVVGAGKSAVIFTSVMKKKELGLINKACVVVPKALTEQTANEWRKVYPDAKILTVTNDDLSNETKRNLFTAKVATGSYDAVILSQEQFEKIPMSKQYRINFMQKELDSLEDMLREKKLENNGKKDYSLKAIEKAKKQLQIKIERLLNPKSASKAKDDLLEFEQLGFDYLVCDEAHAYKNGFVQTKMTNVAGVTTKPSGRAEDMQMKTDYFNEQLGNGHILYCTGTPVSNSMTELYVMTRYLRPDLLKQAGVERFDDWAATFGNVVTKNQQTADGTLKMKTSFASFANLPELMAMYKEFADVQSAEKLNLPRPELKTGKPQIISVPATPEQKMYVHELAERAKAIEDGAVDPHEDNHLKLTSEARLIGLGNNAVKALYEKRGEELPYDFIDDKNSKVDKCIEKVAEIYEKTNDTKGVQIIFSDVAVNSDNGNFSVYNYIKDELIAKGIPKDEIIFAPKSDSKERENIFRDINNSKYRVVIASTGTLGTGANIQQNLYALHHIDVPWKPSDFEQREGRILRQGNQNKEVEIFNYVTEGTLDSYLYQTVTNKARFIAQLLDNKAPARVSEDCDEKVLTYGEIQAAAEGNTDFKRRIEVSNEIAELTMLKNSYNYETAVTKEKIEKLPEEIKLKKEMLLHVQNDRKSAEKIQELALSNPTENDNYVVMTREKVNEYLLKMTQAKLANPEKEIPEVNIDNFNVSVYFDKMNNEVRFSVKGESTYSCAAGTAENQDNYQRLQNLFEKMIPKKEQEIIKEISALEENLEQAKKRVEIPFAQEKELEEKIQEFQELEEKLSALSVQEDIIIDPEEEPIIETAEEKSEREKIYNVDDNDYQPTENDDDSRPIQR